MKKFINTRVMCSELRSVLERVRKSGECFTVLYRSRPVCQLIPPDKRARPEQALKDDSLYRAIAVGSSNDGKTGADHDKILYGSDGR